LIIQYFNLYHRPPNALQLVVIYCQPLATNNVWNKSFASSNVIGRERAVIDPLPDLPPFDVHKWGRENI
jgi:hypothetical protein